VLLVVLATLAGRGWTGPVDATEHAVIALALVVSFRMWDDLMDRERDRVKHPDRVLVRASSPAPVRVVSWIVGLAALASVDRLRGTTSSAFLVAYIAVLAAAYAMRGPRSAAGDRILLLKYGVFTLALIGLPGALDARGLLSAAAAFAVACAYEWWHDAESPVFSFGGSR
jgi:hypothetical protein